LQRLQERLRGQFCFCFHYTIEKPGLLEIVDWLGFVNRGNVLDLDASRRERGDGCAKVGFAVAYV
jgi:hypothetical protein